MLIKQYKLQKIEVSSKEFQEPLETVYYFETHIRRSIRIVPLFTTWNQKQFNKPEEVYEFEVTCIYLSFNCRAEVFTIRKSELESLYFAKDKNSEFVRSWVDGCFDERLKEHFEADKKICLDKINGL